MVLLLLVFGLWASWYKLRGGSSAVKQDSASGAPAGRASTDADNKELTSLLPEMLHSPAVIPDSVVSRKGVGGNRAPALIQTLPQDQPSKIHLSPADPDQRVLHSAASNRAVMISNEAVPPILTNPMQIPVVPQLSSQSNIPEPALTNESADQHQPFPRKAIKVVSPKYPKLAELRHIEGDVLLELYIDSSGKVQGVRAVSGNSALTGAAQEAVRQWRYTPLQNDQPSSASVTWVRFTFKLNPEAKR
jgi:TonB family protein